MRNGAVPGFYWTSDGFLMDELFRGTCDAPVYADSQLVVMRTSVPPGLRFAGEVDVSNSDAVAQSIRIALGDTSRSHVDVSALSFMDVSGIRAFVDAAHDMGDGRQLLLHGLAHQLETVMRLTGWADIPSFVLCECGVESQ